jgi:hypothetical protein
VALRASLTHPSCAASMSIGARCVQGSAAGWDL